MHIFSFESYGVCVALECDSEDAFQKAKMVIRKGLIGNLTEIDRKSAEYIFKIQARKTGLYLELNGEELADQGKETTFFSYFDTWVRLVVAEHAKDLVFLHCGAIEINGKGILFPGDSFTGKTTLVAELVKLGATYYSDEYALIDTSGRLHPFARLLAIRDRVDLTKRTDTSAAELGGISGIGPVPVAAVLFIKYERYARWNPRQLTAGEGLMKLLPQAIPLRFKSEFTLTVLNKLTETAIFIESERNSVENSVNKIKYLIDKL